MSKHKISIGSIEPIKTESGVLLKFFNESTNHEIGITISNQLITIIPSALVLFR